MTVRLQPEYSFSSKLKIVPILVLLLALSGCSVYTAVYGQLNNFIDESKNMPGSPDPNSRFVVLNSGIAAMAEQQFGLPKNTQTYPLAGMTVFPYYQASAPLKEFLNNAMVFGMPVTKFPTTPNLPQVSLPPTDLVRRSIPIPSAPFERGKSAKLSINDKKMKDEVPWMVAHEGGQAIQVPGDNEALALVAPGSMFSACASRTMVLRCGTMWIFTGARPAAVLTKDAAVLVKPFSIAALETTWYNRLRVASLYGQPVEMQVAYEGKADKCIVENRKEITISEVLVEGSAGNTLISSKSLADGNKSVDSKKGEAGVNQSLAKEETAASGRAVNKTTVATTVLGKTAAENTLGQAPDLNTVALAVPGLKAFSASINPRKCNLLGELAAVEPPFSNPRMTSDFARMFSSFGITVAMRREEMKRQILQKYNLATKTAISKLGQNAAPLPACGPLNFPNPTEELKTVRLNKGSARCLANAELSIEKNGNLYLASGEAVFVAAQALVIRSNSFSVHMRAGSTVQMVARKDVILVRNLGEEEPNSVKIRMGNHIFDCGAGAELMAGTSAPAIFDEMKNDGIARRNIQSTESGNAGVVVNKCEVSLTTLMQYSPIMRKLYKSKDSADKKLVSNLMKTIVALNMVTGTHGNYRRMSGLHGVQ